MWFQAYRSSQVFSSKTNSSPSQKSSRKALRYREVCRLPGGVFQSLSFKYQLVTTIKSFGPVWAPTQQALVPGSTACRPSFTQHLYSWQESAKYLTTVLQELLLLSSQVKSFDFQRDYLTLYLPTYILDNKPFDGFAWDSNYAASCNLNFKSRATFEILWNNIALMIFFRVIFQY